mgnify:CR=1 FL=1
MVRPLAARTTYILVSIVVGLARRSSASGCKIGSYCTPGRKSSPTQWLLWELAHP